MVAGLVPLLTDSYPQLVLRHDALMSTHFVMVFWFQTAVGRPDALDEGSLHGMANTIWVEACFGHRVGGTGGRVPLY